MRGRWSHPLQPLTTLTSEKVNFKCIDVKKKEFYDIKRVMARNTLSANPCFNKLFDVHTNARNFQLGAVINKEVKPIAFYILKLMDPQM